MYRKTGATFVICFHELIKRLLLMRLLILSLYFYQADNANKKRMQYVVFVYNNKLIRGFYHDFASLELRTH